MRYICLQETIKFVENSDDEFTVETISTPIYNDDILSTLLEHINNCKNGKFDECFRVAYIRGKDHYYEIGMAIVDSLRQMSISDYMLPEFEPVVYDYLAAGCDNEFVYSLDDLELDEPTEDKEKIYN